MWLFQQDTGKKLRQLMSEYDVSNKELAIETGISPNTISRLRRQDQLPNIETARLIADYFKVKIQYIWPMLKY